MFVAVYPPVPSQALIGALLASGHHPVPVESLADAAKKAPEAGWPAAVVEVGDDLGLAVGMAAKLRTDQAMPVLLVADRTRTSDLGESGEFDDFVLTPIDAVELGVRLRRLAGASGEDSDDDVLRHRDLELNTATYQATVAGEPRDLTYMEYELLRFFVENPGRVWSRDQILLEGVGLRLLRRLANGRRPRAPPARQARGRTQLVDHHGPQRRLPLRLSPFFLLSRREKFARRGGRRASPAVVTVRARCRLRKGGDAIRR